MPLPSIPTGLLVSATGYSFDGPGGVRATEVAGGLPRIAMEWDRGHQPFRCTIKARNTYEMGIWSIFFHNTIKKGSLPFSMLLDSGLGVSLHDVQMIPDSYTAARASNGVATLITFGVWAESQVYGMTGAQVAQILDLHEASGGRLGELLQRLDRFATVDTLVLSP